MVKVKAIAEGYHALTPTYTVKGAGEFIDWCKKVFGAEERMRMPGPNNEVMHCELKIGDSIMMCTDAIQDPPTHSATFVYANDCDAVFNKAVQSGAKALMQPTDMFWGDRFARVEDKWGNRWGIATHIEDVPPAEMQKRAAAEMQRMQQQKK
jgi:PhnB protein